MFTSLLYGVATGTSNAIGWSDLSSVLNAMTDQISVTTVIGVIAGVVGAAIALVFMWWGARTLPQIVF